MNDKDQQTHRLAILTSGGDAPGMNAALRAAVRTALEEGLEVVAIREGYRGLVEGGDAFRPMDWDTRSAASCTWGAPSSAPPAATSSANGRAGFAPHRTSSSTASTA